MAFLCSQNNNTRKTKMAALSTLFLSILLSTGIYAQTTKYNSYNGKAIKGYDPVAYFIEQKAIEGNSNFSFDWSGNS